MANTMTGRIHLISPTQTITSKKDSTKNFTKRTITLDCTKTDPTTGEKGYPNFPTFEFSGDKCLILDNFKIGQQVTITFSLQGTKFIDAHGDEKYFTSVRAYQIENMQTGQTSDDDLGF